MIGCLGRVEESSAMPLPSFDELYRRADARREPLPLAAVGGAEATVLEALRAAVDRGWVAPLVFGHEREIREVADVHGIDLHGMAVLDENDSAGAAVAAVRAGRACLLMKGQIATPALMRAILDPAAGLRTGRVICQVVLLEVRPSGRRFLLADTGICIRPTLEQQADILRHAVAVAHSLGTDVPHVAALAATETVTDAMPETRDAAELQRRGAAGEFPGCVVQGPLSFDLACAAEAGDRKRLGGPVVGAADILLFPDLLSANLTVKGIAYTADCRFGGVLCGAACPVVFMSRSDSTATRLNSLALALNLVAM
jgi:phosphate butyryltransferase